MIKTYYHVCMYCIRIFIFLLIKNLNNLICKFPQTSPIINSCTTSPFGSRHTLVALKMAWLVSILLLLDI